MMATETFFRKNKEDGGSGNHDWLLWNVRLPRCSTPEAKKCKRGVSGTKLIWFFMLFFLAMPMLAFGALFGLGPVLSIIPLSIIVLIAGGIWVHTKAKA